MFPVLFEFFGIKIYTYGVLVALGVFVGYFLLLRLGKKEGLNTTHLENTLLITLFFGIVFARIAYILEHPEQVGKILDIFAIWQGGLPSLVVLLEVFWVPSLAYTDTNCPFGRQQTSAP
jgi:phosphatidylglycerol---prolipoprotein diacylglyceryl transferase